MSIGKPNIVDDGIQILDHNYYVYNNRVLNTVTTDCAVKFVLKIFKSSWVVH